MGEYSQEEVDTLALEAEEKMRQTAAHLTNMGEALERMADLYVPGDDLDALVKKAERLGFVDANAFRTNGDRYFVAGVCLEPIERTITACNDEHSGLQYEQEHPEEVAS